MAGLRDPDRFLLKRGNRWYYQRRVPNQFSHLDDRAFVKVSLKTGSQEVARLRRDQLAEADDQYWMALAVEAGSPGGRRPAMRAALEHRYKAAISRAMAYPRARVALSPGACAWCGFRNPCRSRPASRWPVIAGVRWRRISGPSH